MTASADPPSGRSADSLPEGANDASHEIASDGRSLEGDDGELQGDPAIHEDEDGDGI